MVKSNRAQIQKLETLKRAQMLKMQRMKEQHRTPRKEMVTLVQEDGPMVGLKRRCPWRVSWQKLDRWSLRCPNQNPSPSKRRSKQVKMIPSALTIR